MATVTIDAPSLERGIFDDQWQALARQLEDAGHDVVFERRYEERGGSASQQLPPGVEPGTIVFIVLYVAGKLVDKTLTRAIDKTLDEVLDEVIDAVVRNLRGRARGNPRRQVVIVDEHGKPLRTVDVPVDDE